MKEKESIEILAQIYDSGEIPLNADPAFKIAIKALKKQIPKKPKKSGVTDSGGVFHPINGINGVPYDLCPNCEINLCTDGVFGGNKRGIKYCKNCGQKLDWETEF